MGCGIRGEQVREQYVEVMMPCEAKGSLVRGQPSP